MLSNIKDLFLFLSSKDKKKIYLFQLYILIASFFEVFSFASIIPFISIVSNNDIIFSNQYIFFLYNYLGYNNKNDFILFFGILTICLIIISNLILSLSTYLTSYMVYHIGLGFSRKLYKFYINQNYLFHMNNDNSYLIAKITTESLRLCNQVIMSILVSNSKFFIILILVIPLLVYDFVSTSLVFISVFITYFLFFYFLRRTLSSIGKKQTKLNLTWFKAVKESLGAIKELILLERLERYSKIVDKINIKIAKNSTLLDLLSFLPKYIVETLAMIIIISVILFLYFIYMDFMYLIPYLSFIAVFSYKFIPNAQLIYFNISRIKANIEAFKNLKQDLNNSYSRSENYNQKIDFEFNNKIFFKNIYLNLVDKNKEKEILKNVNLTFYKNKINALVGYSGAGKTSVINILSGLIEPSAGLIYIDDIHYKNLCYSNWHKKIGYVPQRIFLLNDDIVSNVCLGLSKKEIDISKLKSALVMANLEEFLSEDKNGIYRNVGDSGIKLSGGQMQRMGIARALYDTPEIIIFDEPTSAFDAKTERIFYKLLDKLSEKMTIIIITHKVDYLKKAKNISFLNKGTAIMHGTYDELIKNEEFKKLSIIHQK